MSNTERYYFNWEELKIHGDNQFEAILVLLYASIVGYNKRLSDTRSYLYKKLNIDFIPNCVFRKKYIEKFRTGLYSKYKCHDEQCYFINNSFLMARCPVRAKIEYLFLLSHRRLNDSNTYIPKSYIDEKYWNNIFVYINKDKLHFTLEET